MGVDHEIRRLAATQCGLLHRRQLTDIGLSPAGVRHRLRDGILAWASPTVLMLVGCPETAAQRALAAVFDSGRDSALGQCSAASWWQLPGYQLDPLMVVRSHGMKPRPSHLARVHQSRDLVACDITVVGGVPVTTPERTLLDLAAIEPLGRVARTLDTALARRLARLDALDLLLQRVARKGRPGVTVMRTLIGERRDQVRFAESGLELRFERILVRHGLPRFERQVDLGGADGWIARVDFLHRASAIVVFIDSELHHTAFLDVEHDNAQTRALEAIGYTVIRFSDAQVLYRESEIVDRLQDAFRSVLRAS